MGLFSIAGSWFDKKKAILVHCPRCGGNSPAIQIRCSSCGAYIRALWPLCMAAMLLSVTCLVHSVYLYGIIPSLAAIYVKYGMTLYLPVRIDVALTNFIFDYLWIGLALFITGFIFLAFLWKPEKNWGRNLILSAAVLYAIYVIMILFSALLMISLDLPPRVISNQP